MQADDRKAAVAAYKERKVEAGAYAVKCTGSGQVWVGIAPDLSTIQNRLWFTLRQGSNSHLSLQEAWRAYGADAFTFEIVDRLPEDEPGYRRNATLKTMHSQWALELNATRI